MFSLVPDSKCYHELNGNRIHLNKTAELSEEVGPLYFSEKMKELGELGDILLADFSAYAVGMRRQASIARSIEPGWDEDLVSFRVRLRATGQPLISQPITPVNGTTVSPFVTLGAR